MFKTLRTYFQQKKTQYFILFKEKYDFNFDRYYSPKIYVNISFKKT